MTFDELCEWAKATQKERIELTLYLSLIRSRRAIFEIMDQEEPSGG